MQQQQQPFFHKHLADSQVCGHIFALISRKSHKCLDDFSQSFIIVVAEGMAAKLGHKNLQQQILTKKRELYLHTIPLGNTDCCTTIATVTFNLRQISDQLPSSHAETELLSRAAFCERAYAAMHKRASHP